MLNIGGMKSGYVIDHITAGNWMKIYKALALDKYEGQVAIIQNAKSKKQGKKDIIKIEGLVKLDLDLLGFLDNNITVNIVEDNAVIKKEKLSLPEKISGVAHCKNPRCITSTEQELEQVFVLTDRANHVYRCVYCEEKL